MGVYAGLLGVYVGLKGLYCGEVLEWSAKAWVYVGLVGDRDGAGLISEPGEYGEPASEPGLASLNGETPTFSAAGLNGDRAAPTPTWPSSPGVFAQREG